MKVKGRTIREFQPPTNLWDIVASWAQQSGYKPVSRTESSILYQRGTGILVAPQMLQVTLEGGFCRLEAWVKIPMINRIFTLGLMPGELVIDKGGSIGMVPRDKARSQVNLLLRHLGLPLIGELQS